MPLTRHFFGWCTRGVLALRWHAWRQMGMPERALSALNEQLARWGVLADCGGASGDSAGAAQHAVGAVHFKHSALPVHLLATRAHLLGQLGRWQDARAQLEQVLVMDPGNAMHTFNLGYVCARLGDADAAAQSFRVCLSLAPRMDQAWFGLGEALFAKGDLAGAETAWTEQVGMQPLCPDGYAGLVRLSVQRQDMAAARLWLDRLRTFEPRQALALEPLVAQLAATTPALLAQPSA